LTRLQLLNVSDNFLKDLPLSIGLCEGLGSRTAGIKIDSNPIKDKSLKMKYEKGPDHLYDFLEVETA
jgi:hypothetical protein